MYEIATNDFYKDIAKDVRRKFDTSDYPEKHPSGRIKAVINKKVIGTFKDKAAGKQITHFVGLRPKLYSYKLENKDNRKCKGIKKNVMKKEITFNDYKQCLFLGEEEMRTMNIIKSEYHDIYSMKVNKIALSADDNKCKIKKD